MILETAVNTTRQSRNRTQTSFNAEGAEQRGGEEHFLSPFSAFLSESLRLCVKSSQPASLSPCVLARLRVCVDSIRSVSRGVEPIRVLFGVLGNLGPDRFQRGLRFPSPDLRGPV